MQSRQMAEVNLNTAKHGGKHLQHHPAQESSQETIVGGERYRKRRGKINDQR